MKIMDNFIEVYKTNSELNLQTQLYQKQLVINKQQQLINYLPSIHQFVDQNHKMDDQTKLQLLYKLINQIFFTFTKSQQLIQDVMNNYHIVLNSDDTICIIENMQAYQQFSQVDQLNVHQQLVNLISQLQPNHFLFNNFKTYKCLFQFLIHIALPELNTFIHQQLSVNKKKIQKIINVNQIDFDNIISQIDIFQVIFVDQDMKPCNNKDVIINLLQKNQKFLQTYSLVHQIVKQTLKMQKYQCIYPNSDIQLNDYIKYLNQYDNIFYQALNKDNLFKIVIVDIFCKLFNIEQAIQSVNNIIINHIKDDEILTILQYFTKQNIDSNLQAIQQFIYLMYRSQCKVLFDSKQNLIIIDQLGQFNEVQLQHDNLLENVNITNKRISEILC